MAVEVSCETCCDWKKEAFRERSRNGDMDYMHVEDLQSSAGAGCVRCGVLQDILSHFWPLWKKATDQGCDSIPKLETLFVTFDYFQSEDYDTFYGTKAYAHWEADSNGLNILPDTIELDIFLSADFSLISGDTSCAKSTQKARNWLGTCLSSHETCDHEPKNLPKRVIDVTPRRKREPPRLLETAKFGQFTQEKPRYVCLSHCWGKKPLIRTTESSIDQHREGIPWQKLSKTFQDAICLTLEFNIDYIWIDSLCIVQDDQSDWQEQAGEIASIYENCLFTITATASSDGSGGCYRTLGPDYLCNREFTRKNNSGELWTAFARKIIQHPDIAIHGTAGYKIEAPLIDRAWCFQEHVLTPRLLQYTAAEIMWECNEMLTCECGRVDPKRYHRKRPSPRATNPAGEVAVLAEWYQIVEAYTMRILTYPSDKLPALSGLAKRTKQRLLPNNCGDSNNRYLAGLWECDLLTGLAWTALGDPIDWSRATPYRAPTWSWASVDGNISWHRPVEICKEQEPVARVIHASCDLAGLDPTGSVAGGTLILSGVAICVTVTKYQLSEHQWAWEQLRHFISYTGPSTGGVESSRKKYGWDIDSDYQWADPGDLYIAPGEKLTCLRLGWERKGGGDRSEGAEVGPPSSFRTLLLRPSRAVTGAFERVGAISAGEDDPLHLWFHDAEEIRVTII